MLRAVLYVYVCILPFKIYKKECISSHPLFQLRQNRTVVYNKNVDRAGSGISERGVFLNSANIFHPVAG